MEIVGWPLSDTNSARSLNDFKNNEKAISMGDPCTLVGLSAISPLGKKKMAFIERSLRDHWAIAEIVEKVASLGDHWEIVLDWVKTLRRPWQPWRSLDDHWQIIEGSWQLLGALWKIVERSSHFFIAQRSLNDRHLCVKGFEEETDR